MTGAADSQFVKPQLRERALCEREGEEMLAMRVVTLLAWDRVPVYRSTEISLDTETATLYPRSRPSIRYMHRMDGPEKQAQCYSLSKIISEKMRAR